MADKNKYNTGPEEEGLIIHHPDAMSPTRRNMELSLTVFGWMVWVFLCRPALVAFLWVMGFEFFHEHMIRLGGISALVDFSFAYITSVFVLYLVIRSWNFYNARRFRGWDKRKINRSVNPRDLETCFHLPEGSVSEIQGSDYIDVKFFPESRIQIDVPSKKMRTRFFDGYFKTG